MAHIKGECSPRENLRITSNMNHTSRSRTQKPFTAYNFGIYGINASHVRSFYVYDTRGDRFSIDRLDQLARGHALLSRLCRCRSQKLLRFFGNSRASTVIWQALALTVISREWGDNWFRRGPTRRWTVALLCVHACVKCTQLCRVSLSREMLRTRLRFSMYPFILSLHTVWKNK